MAGSGGDRRASSGGIAGRVLTPSGAAVAGARVMIGGNSPPHPDIAALTSAGGEYRFVNLTPGDYEIHAYVNERLQAQRARVGAGEIAVLDFVVEE